MGKFKRGDKIRVTVDGWRSGNHNAQAGDVYVVNDVSSEGVHTNLFYFTFDEIELVPVAEATGTDVQAGNTLRIQSGKFYLTRDGRKVGPMRRWSDEAKHRWEADDDDLPYIWADDGTEADSDFDDSADLVAEAESSDSGNAAGSTAGFTVPVFDEDDFDICGYRDNDDDIVQLSVGELTAALADSLKVARKVGKPIKRGDLVVLARPALVTGIDRYHASIQTDGGNYSLPLAALTAA